MGLPTRPMDDFKPTRSFGSSHRRSAYAWRRRKWARLAGRIPRGAGVAATALLIASTVTYGTWRGGHSVAVLDQLATVRDEVANLFGFRLTEVVLTGNRQVGRDEIFALAHITDRTSLLFLDVEDARVRLKTNPWIAEATVLKFFPDRLQINVTERAAYALWQNEGRIYVIADDGTPLEPYTPGVERFRHLPLVVGEGAASLAKPFYALLDRFPDISDRVRAVSLVANRRWNLRLRNGIDVRLPETGVEQALKRLVTLDRDRRLLSRDIEAVDLRIADRVTVRLSDAAARARREALTKQGIIKSQGDST